MYKHICSQILSLCPLFLSPSARSVLKDMKFQVRKELQLISFHTVSKGAFGECGLRGGFMEMINIPDDVVAQMYKVGVCIVMSVYMCVERN